MRDDAVLGRALPLDRGLGPATVEASNFKFGTQLGFETSLPKNNVLDQNSRGSGPGGTDKVSKG